jgi:formylglycine-generating enzyme required for sulfatase activity/TRAP-type uncharacterized transport system substrate-binding protein
MLEEKSDMTGCSQIIARTSRAALALIWIGCLAAGAGRAEARVEDHGSRGLVALATGGGDGASIRMAQEIARLISGGTLRLMCVIGNGSLQNLTDLRLPRGVDIAIVQSDILEFARQNNEVSGIDNTTYVARLHNEEVHLLARAYVRGIEDLAGRKVAFAGGASITGPAILNLLHLDIEPVYDDPETALAKLKSGEVAAFAYVAAKPTPLFRDLGPGDGVHFVSIPLKVVLPGAFMPARITAEDYPELVAADSPVSTVAVGMVMVASNMTPSSERYRSVADFVDAFFTRFPQLQQSPRHPKWTEVNLAAELPGWKRFAPAEAWLKRHATAPSTDEKAAFEAFLATPARLPGGAALSPEQKDALFDQFRQWQGGSAPGSEVAAAAPADGTRRRIATASPAAASLSPLPGSLEEKVRLPGGTLLEMVTLPGGIFLMGSHDDASEQPVHRVTIPSFSIARYPVTVRQWKECSAAKDCAEIDAGDDDAPMTGLSWDDAKDFVAWLAKVTKREYRLPSEAEWEYAARAGTQTKYWWGDQMESGMADCKGCGASYDPRHRLKVGAFPPNPFGLNDMTGTVAEWVADCWHKDYRDAPAANAPWDSGDCPQHVLRGGSWQNDPTYLRASNRDAYDSSVRYVSHGFRPARSDDDPEKTAVRGALR